MKRHSYDSDDVIHTVKNDIRPNPGLGESGTRIDILEFSDTDLNDHGYQVSNCRFCGYDRVQVVHDFNPVFPTPFEYRCANPECSWQTEEEFSDEFEEKYC